MDLDPRNFLSLVSIDPGNLQNGNQPHPDHPETLSRHGLQTNEGGAPEHQRVSPHLLRLHAFLYHHELSLVTQNS